MNYVSTQHRAMSQARTYRSGPRLLLGSQRFCRGVTFDCAASGGEPKRLGVSGVTYALSHRQCNGEHPPVKRVAVNRSRGEAGAIALLCVLPANRNKNREPTSGLEPLTCSLRVSSHTFTAVSRGFRNRLHKPRLPILRFWMFLDLRPGYCQGYCQKARLGYSL
jgi:hypothetical protein